jgi:sterol desaturase/sphingolipid hydroxylase (fatty acid hydroxylase superfamily)
MLSKVPSSRSEVAPGRDFGPSHSVWFLPTVLLVVLAAAALAVGVGASQAIFSAGLFVSLVAIGFALERSFPFERRRSDRPTAVPLEIANSLFNAAVVGQAISLGIPLLIVGILGQGAGDVRIGGVANLPIVVQVLLSFLVMDLARYWIHRWQHRVYALWRFHTIHHCIAKVRLSNALFAHPVDYVLRNVLPLLIPAWIGFRPAAVLVAVAIVQALGLLTHFNVGHRCGWLSYVFATNENHRWHHNIDPACGADRNFGIGLIIWDVLFGSFYLPTDQVAPAQMGREGAAPRGFWDLIALPFSRIRVGIPVVHSVMSSQPPG